MTMKRNAKMKKLMTMLGVAGLAVASYAAVNDTLITFSTPGPDKYMDGSAVLPGECYALVWSQDGNFDGIKADGSTIDPNDKVVLVADIAKQNEKGEGYCPLVIYQVDAALADTLKDGQYAVYLLDTRVFADDGTKTVGGLDENGKLKAVNTIVAVSDNTEASAELGAQTAAAAKTAAYSVDCYAKVDAPTITGIKVDGAKITVTASGLSPVANYWIVKGSEPGAVKTPISNAKFDADGKCTFDKPAEAFFKIEGGYKVNQ